MRHDTDLGGVAADRWRLMAHRGHTFTPTQLRRGLNARQFRTVKRYIRETAIETGTLFGYVPSIERYLVITERTVKHVAELLAYARDHWIDAGKAADLTFEAAARAGFASQAEYEFIHNRFVNFMQDDVSTRNLVTA